MPNVECLMRNIKQLQDEGLIEVDLIVTYGFSLSK